jgi:hypothetical protein
MQIRSSLLLCIITTATTEYYSTVLGFLPLSVEPFADANFRPRIIIAGVCDLIEFEKKIINCEGTVLYCTVLIPPTGEYCSSYVQYEETFAIFLSCRLMSTSSVVVSLK